MNQILTSLTTIKPHEYSTVRSHTHVTSAIITAVVMMLVSAMSITYLTGCSKSNSEPDYISQLGTISPVLEEHFWLPEDKEYRDKDLKAMIWESRDIITTGTYQNATTYRMKFVEKVVSSVEITTWFLKRDFTCGALTALAGKYLNPAAIPHVYRKGNTLIHVLRYEVPPLKGEKVEGGYIGNLRLAIIQYKNVTQTFYPCQGKYVSVSGITDPMPIIKHQDGHVTIDHTIANRFWKARLQMEENK